ncbi:hypothetical protein I3J14_25960 [Streptomyces sp. HB-N217]|uniref:hypothetical protein n=1 Tax=Streptomyces sp. HB-N217 TaxID=2792016 RepID=UPI0018D7A6EA|nr:hypothetical protein [Streptomyces sp. HB-N217]MBH5133548.1 hypothetical protein [Streptomyces sp. HB-N217]
MSAPVHRSSERPSAATLAAARQRREEGRAGTSSGAGTSAEQALLGLQSSAGNRAATATVQRARGRTLERTPGTDTARPGSAPGARHAPAGLTRRGSAPGALGDRAPLGTGSGTRPASVAEVRVDTSAPEPVAAPGTTAATRFAPSGRTRRGSDTDTRPGPTALTRRGSESGTHGLEVDPGFQEHVDTAREEARTAAAERAAAEEAERRAALAARFTPSGRTRRGSDTDTRPGPTALTRRGSESGTHGLEVDPGFEEHVDTAREEARTAAERAAAEEAERRAAERAAEEARLAAERAAAAEEEAARRAALAARFTSTGRARRGSDTDTRPDPATLTRRGSESGTHGLGIDPRLQEEARLAAERAAQERAAAEEAARRAALAARFTSTGRARRGSDTDTRPDPATLTRRGSESGTHGLGIDPVFQTELDTARDAARVTEAPSGKKSDRLKEIAENADQGKRILDPADALGKGVQAPTAAGLGQQATEEAAAAAKPDATPAEASGASAASALKHDAAAAGVAGASLSAGAELLALGASVADAFRNLKTSLQKKAGAGYHNARRKAKVKAGDAGMSVASTGANAGAIAKEAIKVEGVASTAASAEASGVLSGVAGVAKSIRALGKTGGAIRKYRNLGKLPDAETAHAGLLARLKAPADAEERRAKAAYDEVVALQRESEQGRPREGWQAAFDAAVRSYEAAAQREAQAKLTYLRALNDARTVDGTKKFARRKQVSKAVKEGMGGGLGEGLKGAGGIATVAIVATGALASNPAGWIVAAAGAGLVVLTAGYKGVRSGYGRFQEVHHPERYTPHGEEVPEAKPTWESLKHAMKVWKKVSKYKRQLAAHKLYDMVSRPDTEPELRRSALDLLVVLKAGPTDHGMDPRTWQESLMDPAAKADWIKEITDQLSSGS